MTRFLFGTVMAGALLAGGAAIAQTQQDTAGSASGSTMQQGQAGSMPMMQQGAGPGMMQGRGMMGGGHGRGGMKPHMMLMMMALVDTDASGTLSLEEVQAVHARMFQYADENDDGELTLEELRSFMHGGAMPGGQ